MTCVKLLLGAALGFGLIGCAGVTVIADRYFVVDAQEALRLAADSATTIVDLRPPEDFDSGHVPRALSIPLNHLWVRMDELPSFYDSPILLYDELPSRQARAGTLLVQEGYYKVYSVRGGYPAWERAGGLVSSAPALSGR